MRFLTRSSYSLVKELPPSSLYPGERAGERGEAYSEISTRCFSQMPSPRRGPAKRERPRRPSALILSATAIHEIPHRFPLLPCPLPGAPGRGSECFYFFHIIRCIHFTGVSLISC